MPSAELIGFLQSASLSALLASGRMLGLMLFFPLFAWTGVSGTLRTMITVVLGAPVAVMLYPSVSQVESIGMLFVLLMAKEVMVGIGVAMLAGIPFWAAQAAGDLIDTYRGASQANIFDPLSAAESSVSGTIMLLVTLALFVVAGGFSVVVGLIYDSYAAWNVLDLVPNISAQTFNVFLRLLTEIFRQAAILAGPILIALGVAEMLLLLVARGWKQYNAMDLNTIGKNIAYMILLPIYLIFFVSYLEKGWDKALSLVRIIVPAVR
jgi:type III secretion protein T